MLTSQVQRQPQSVSHEAFNGSKLVLSLDNTLIIQGQNYRSPYCVHLTQQAQRTHDSDAVDDMIVKNYGVFSSHAISAQTYVRTSEMPELKIITLPTNTSFYKGIKRKGDERCDDSAQYDLVTNIFGRTMSWYGDLKTAEMYAKPSMLAFKNKRPLRLVNLMDPSNIKLIRSIAEDRMETAKDALTVQTLEKGLEALGIATGYGVTVEEQYARMDRDKYVDETKKIDQTTPPARNTKFRLRKPEDSRLRVLDAIEVMNPEGGSVVHGGHRNHLNRLSILHIDNLMVHLLLKVLPALDGYYADAVPSLYHHVFHPEICLFSPGGMMGRDRTSVADCSADESSTGVMTLARIGRDGAAESSILKAQRKFETDMERENAQAMEALQDFQNIKGGSRSQQRPRSSMRSAIYNTSRRLKYQSSKVVANYEEPASMATRNLVYRDMESQDDLDEMDAYINTGRGFGRKFPLNPW